MSRPEHQAPPEIFYNDQESAKYTNNSHIIQVQQALTDRAVELLNFNTDSPRLLLDLGCGSGLSGEVLSEYGHFWVGLDINVAREKEVEGDLMLQDLGQGLGFRPGSFDGAISISAIQWLCNADKSSHSPRYRLTKFFSTLYACLCRGARAVFQFYPENSTQIELITGAALKCGFSGGVVIDYPNSTKAKKYFLVLMVGQADPLPEAKIAEDDSQITVAENQRRKSKKKVHDKDWILKKKELARKRGYENIPDDTKYTGRKRKIRF